MEKGAEKRGKRAEKGKNRKTPQAPKGDPRRVESAEYGQNSWNAGFVKNGMQMDILGHFGANGITRVVIFGWPGRPVAVGSY